MWNLLFSTVRLEQVGHFWFLGTNISNDLSWDNNIISIIKKAQQRLYFLYLLKMFTLVGTFWSYTQRILYE